MDDYREKSFWLSELVIEPNPPLSGSGRCDVAIIGGGFTGIATAYFLKKFDPALEVTLLEKDIVGYGASGRNAGFSMKLFGFSLAMTKMRFGAQAALEAHRYMTEAVHLVQELVDEHQIDCDYEHTGFLRVATSKAYEKRIKSEIDFAHSMGIDDIQWLDAHQVAQEVRSPNFLGGAYEKDSAILNPAKLVRAMKEIVEQMGTTIYCQSPVEEISISDKVLLKTPTGQVTADRAVLATNAYTHLLPIAKSKQAPAFTHIILTEPLTEEHLDAIGWQNRMGLEDARNLIHYFRLTADNRLLIGGSDVQVPFGKNMDLDQDERVFRQLEQDLTFLFPQLSELKVEHRWGGPVSVTLDMAPAIGQMAGGKILYSLGCVGHGVSLTHLNGKTLAELILGRVTERTETFFVNRWLPPWPPEPLRFAATRTIRSALRLQDRFTDAPQ